MIQGRQTHPTSHQHHMFRTPGQSEGVAQRSDNRKLITDCNPDQPPGAKTNDGEQYREGTFGRIGPENRHGPPKKGFNPRIGQDLNKLAGPPLTGDLRLIECLGNNCVRQIFCLKQARYSTDSGIVGQTHQFFLPAG